VPVGGVEQTQGKLQKNRWWPRVKRAAGKVQSLLGRTDPVARGFIPAGLQSSPRTGDSICLVHRGV